MKTLYVLYDADCAFCRRCRYWLAAEPAYITLKFVPRQSPEASSRFPEAGTFLKGDELVVISDEGALYHGPSAFIMCLYALRDYREWAMRLSRPALLPLARKAVELLSEHRLKLSKWLGKAPDDEVARTLQLHSSAECESGVCHR